MTPIATPAVSLRDRNKQRVRTQIVGSAMKLVAARGLGNVTAEDIARAADVGRATFFRYFASKEAAIIVGFYEQRLNALIGMLKVAPKELGPMDAVIWTFRNLGATDAPTDIKLVRLHARMVTSSPALRAKAMEFQGPFEKAIAEAVAPRFRKKRDDVRPRLVGAAALAVIQASVDHWAQRDCEPDLSELCISALEHLKAGFADRAA